MAKKKRAAWGSVKRVKLITLRYMINGARFKREYLPEHYEAAQARCEALRECGVRVKVRNWPKQVVRPVPTLVLE